MFSKKLQSYTVHGWQHSFVKQISDNLQSVPDKNHLVRYMCLPITSPSNKPWLWQFFEFLEQGVRYLIFTGPQHRLRWNLEPHENKTLKVAQFHVRSKIVKSNTVKINKWKVSISVGTCNIQHDLHQKWHGKWWKILSDSFFYRKVYKTWKYCIKILPIFIIILKWRE